MLLEVCTEKSLIFSNYKQYIDALCLFVFFFYILLVFVLKRKELFSKTFNTSMIKINLITPFVIFMLFLSIILLSFFVSSNPNGCYCKIPKKLSVLPENNTKLKPLENFISNKVIIVGDSRMEQIVDSRDELEIPSCFTFVAESGASRRWFEDIGLKKVKDILDNRNSLIEYHVVINMGVNDIQYYKNLDLQISEYINDYNKLVSLYPTVNFYLLSINPINEEKLNISQPYNVRTTKAIEHFNKRLIENVSENDFENLKYCDSYHNIKFFAPDGIHYDFDTNQNIINYITRNCVEYK